MNADLDQLMQQLRALLPHLQEAFCVDTLKITVDLVMESALKKPLQKIILEETVPV